MKPLHRRQFLKATGTALLATTGHLHIFAAAPGTRRPLKKAVNLGMVNIEGSTTDKFKLLKEIGFDGVEVNRPGNPSPEEILKARDATGLPIAGIMNSVHWKIPLSDPDPEVRAQSLEGLRTCLRDAHAFGAPSVLLVPAVVSKKVSYDDAWTRSQAEIRKAVPLAEELGVKIAIENVGNFFLLSPLEAARYVDSFQSPAVGWHFDVGNIIRSGWPEQWIRILGKRIVNVHIKENVRPKPGDPANRPRVELLEGDCDWPSVMKAFDDVGYHGWGIAEVPGGDATRLKFLAERMDRVFAS